MSQYKHALQRLTRYTYVTLLVLKVLNQNKHATRLKKPYKHATCTCLKYDVSPGPEIKTGTLHVRAEFKY